MVRCFLAIYPLESKAAMKVQEDILNFVNGKMVERENMHITLSFLGEISEIKLNEVKDKVKNLANRLKKVNFILGGIKFVPNSSFIRVIAIETFGLEEISECIKNEVDGDVKPAHLTLIRVKSVKDRKGLIEYSRRTYLNETYELKDIKLMKSTLTIKGPIYEVIQSFPLSL